MRGLRAAPQYLLYAIALAWPLDLYQYVPYLNITVTGALTIALLLLAAQNVASGTKLRVPFDVLLPIGLLAVLLIAIASREGVSISWEVPGALALLIATAHFATSRTAIEGWLRASIFSATIVTILSLAVRPGGLMPTAYALKLPTTFAFAYDLHAGVHILALCLVLALRFTWSKTESPVTRTLMTAAALLIGSTMVAKGLQLLIDGSLPTAGTFLTYSPLIIAALLSTLWLFLRTMAKVEIDRRERPGRMHAAFLAMGIITLLLIALGPFQPRLYHGYLLGLACGYALREREVSYTPAWPKAASAVLVVLVLINARYVFPENSHDPRNYELAAERDFLRGDFDILLQRLDHFEYYAEDELRTHLWRARVALRQGEPNAAAMEFALSTFSPKKVHTTLLPAPTPAEEKDFVVQLRDLTSTLPENIAGCAYERALLAVGNRDSALLSLQLRTSIALVHAEGLNSDVFADAAAFVIGEPSLKPDLVTWTPDELLTLLSHWGAEIRSTPEDFPPSALPAVLVLQRTLSNVELYVSLGPVQKTFQDPLDRSSHRNWPTQEERAKIVWGPLTSMESETLELPLSLTTPEDEIRIGQFNVSKDLPMKWTWTYDGQEPLPFTPAILIYLPDRV